MSKRFIFTIFLVCTHLSHAWFDEGHEVVGEIAWRSLNDETKNKVSDLLKQLQPIYKEAETLATISKLPDHMRSGFRIFDQWHYVTLPIMTFPGTPPATKSPNALWALCECTRTVATVTPTTAGTGFIAWAPKPFERAFMLAFLAHLVGDMHQPLHSVSRFKESLPDGDSGGLLFHIHVDKVASNLHLFWDSGLGYFSSVHDKYSPKVEKWSKTDEVAQKLMKEHPASAFGKKIESVNFNQWAEDGRALAKTIVYDLPEYAEPNKAYIARGQTLVKEHIALAGYRLAYLLTEMLSERGVSAIATGCTF